MEHARAVEMCSKDGKNVEKMQHVQQALKEALADTKQK